MPYGGLHFQLPLLFLELHGLSQWSLPLTLTRLVKKPLFLYTDIYTRYKSHMYEPCYLPKQVPH